ncbi:hypothetical protein CVIRNUC_009114 [Coccomyxa viridis]|uniref:Uncharacterized protein n=1 Tax=Coccomyxa viridis TaxID=1274662 RepID=A0AAV1IGU1_9CHLO|nr:hypothetical protein CVIRNUC_009114 [Coccomyxa viridis]
MARYLLWLQALLSVAIAAQLYTCAAGQYHTENYGPSLPATSKSVLGSVRSAPAPGPLHVDHFPHADGPSSAHASAPAPIPSTEAPRPSHHRALKQDADQAPDLVSWNPLKAIAQSVLNPLGLFNHSAVAPSPQPADGLAWNKSIADPLVASDNTTSSSAANPIWILPLNASQLLNKTEQLNPLDAFKATEPLNATDLAAPVQLATSPSSDEGSPKWKLPVPINGTHHGLAATLDAGDATSPAPFTPEVLSPALSPSETPAAAAAAAQAAQEQKAWLAAAIAKAARAAAPNAHLDASTKLPPVNITLPAAPSAEAAPRPNTGRNQNKANLDTEDVSQSPIGSRSSSTTRALLQARDLIAAAESSLLATLGQGEVAQAITDAVPEMPMDAEVAMGPAAGGLDSPDTAPAATAAPSAHAGPGKVPKDGNMAPDSWLRRMGLVTGTADGAEDHNAPGGRIQAIQKAMAALGPAPLQ